LTLPKLQPLGPSVRKTSYRAAPATAVQDTFAPLSAAVTVTVGAVVGPPAQPLFTGVGVAHCIWCRLYAAKIAVMCGVPSLRSRTPVQPVATGGRQGSP